MNIKHFYDKETKTFSYVVFDKEGGNGIVIDSVLSFDVKSAKFSYDLADEIINFLIEKTIKLDWVLETHAHADHVTAAQYIKSKCGGKVAIHENIKTVQNTFAKLFNIDDIIEHDYYFDYFFKDKEIIHSGDLLIEIIHLPGHTPACSAFKIDDNIFVGDTIFMPDVGSARCDFPGGNAETLFESVQKILSYDKDTNLYMCHDYPNSRELQFKTTIQYEISNNIHFKNKTKSEFIEMRNSRDKTLDVPNLLIPSIQINIRAGHFPPVDDNGIAYLKIPINLF